MDKYKLMGIIVGIGFISLFYITYLGSKSPLDLFPTTLGVLILIVGFYTEKKIKVSISSAVTMFSVNIIQWLFLIYIFYYYPVYVTLEFYFNMVIALSCTLFIYNHVRKKYLKSSETTVNMLKNKTKLILLFVGATVIIGSLAGLIVYLAPIFLYGITLGQWL